MARKARDPEHENDARPEGDDVPTYQDVNSAVDGLEALLARFRPLFDLAPHLKTARAAGLLQQEAEQRVAVLQVDIEGLQNKAKAVRDELEGLERDHGATLERLKQETAAAGEAISKAQY